MVWWTQTQPPFRLKIENDVEEVKGQLNVPDLGDRSRVRKFGHLISISKASKTSLFRSVIGYPLFAFSEGKVALRYRLERRIQIPYYANSTTGKLGVHDGYRITIFTMRFTDKNRLLLDRWMGR